MRLISLLVTLGVTGVSFAQDAPVACLFDKRNDVPVSVAALAKRSPLDKNISLTVRVVFHLVSTSPDILSAMKSQVANQIYALNRDFNKWNNEVNLLPETIREIAASANMRFELADSTPEGEDFAGFTYKLTHVEKIGLRQELFYTERGGTAPWDPARYLNIWVCDMPQSALGYSSSVADIGERFEGVVLNARYFGIQGSYDTPYNLGRTLVHEVGHYFGLNHPWGILTDECQEDDGIHDTPPQRGAHSGCPPTEDMRCDRDQGVPNYYNFMDYTADCCMALFTSEQVRVMRETLMHDRNDLLIHNPENEATASKWAEVEKEVIIFPNPTAGVFSILWKTNPFNIHPPTDQLEIVGLNLAGQVVFETAAYSNAGERFTVCLNGEYQGIILIYLCKAGFSNRYLGRVTIR